MSRKKNANTSEKEHDETLCYGLHEAFTTQTRVYSATRGSDQFSDWFNVVFSKEYPGIAKYIRFEHINFDDTDYLEVVSHMPEFSVETLEALFFEHKSHIKTATSKDIKKSTKQSNNH